MSNNICILLLIIHWEITLQAHFLYDVVHLSQLDRLHLRHFWERASKVWPSNYRLTKKHCAWLAEWWREGDTLRWSSQVPWRSRRRVERYDILIRFVVFCCSYKVVLERLEKCCGYRIRYFYSSFDPNGVSLVLISFGLHHCSSHWAPSYFDLTLSASGSYKHMHYIVA